jgi:TetR/AcrR family acrAB operon transcriptional repressor
VRRTKEDALATRQAILQSALDTFYERGYSKTTFDEIAHRINLTKGAVYWHFRNKPDLVAAILNDILDTEDRHLPTSLVELKSQEDIVAYFSYKADFILQTENNRKTAFFFTNQMEWSETIITKVSHLVEANTQKSCEKIIKALEVMLKEHKISPDTDIDFTAAIIFSSWYGTLSLYLSRRIPFDLKKTLTEGLNLIFKGLGKEEIQDENK